MVTYDDIGNMSEKEKKLSDDIMKIVCIGCDGEEKCGCCGCTKDLEIDAILIEYFKL